MLGLGQHHCHIRPGDPVVRVKVAIRIAGDDPPFLQGQHGTGSPMSAQVREGRPGWLKRLQVLGYQIEACLQAVQLLVLSLKKLDQVLLQRTHGEYRVSTCPRVSGRLV